MKVRVDPRGRLITWLGGLTLLLVVAAWRWPAQDWLAVDFQALLPADSSSPWISVANGQNEQRYGGQMLWLIAGDDSQAVSRFADRLHRQLAAAGLSEPEFEQRERERWAQLTETLLQYRRGLVSRADRAQLASDPEAYFAATRALFYSPLGGAALTFLPLDPSGLFANYLARLTPMEAGDSTNTTQASQLLLTQVPSAQLGFSQLPVLYSLYSQLHRQAADRGIKLAATGAPLYTAFGVHSAQREMHTIGLASLLLLTALLWSQFRSVSALGLTLVCVSTGLGVGLLCTVVLLGQIHVLTLVFGTSLLGISADYALHYLAHSRAAQWQASEGLAKVYTGLRLSVFSSAMAFATLVLLPFSGIKQIGLFMASGLLGSFATVCLLFPVLYRRTTHPRPLNNAARNCQWRGLPRTLWLTAAAAALALLPLAANDNVRAFYAAPLALDEARAEIEAHLNQSTESRYLLIQAPDLNSLLLLEEQLDQQLMAMQNKGVLDTYTALGKLIPPVSRQQATADLLLQPTVTAALRQHMHVLGLEDQVKQTVLEQWGAAFSPLTLRALDLTQLPAGVGGFLGCTALGCASQINFRGITDPGALQALADRSPGVQWIDQVADINASMGQYRRAIATLLVVAALLIALMMGLFYDWRRAADILLYPVLTSLLSLALVGYWQGGLSLANLLALLLLAGVSLDYAIFRSFTPSADQAATSLAIALSACTSVLAFGMLSFSATPVIASFGQTIAVGLCLVWLISWLRPEQQTRQ